MSRSDVSPLASAVVDLFDAIDRAGGWMVFDPVFQERIGKAMLHAKYELMREFNRVRA